MKTQHTPGPWTIGKVSHKKQRVDTDSLHADPSVGHQSWRGLARAYGLYDMPAEGSAAMLSNARLISAAPELLEAQRELRYAATEKAERMADAAIAKATGEKA